MPFKISSNKGLAWLLAFAEDLRISVKCFLQKRRATKRPSSLKESVLKGFSCLFLPVVENQT